MKRAVFDEMLIQIAHQRQQHKLPAASQMSIRPGPISNPCSAKQKRQLAVVHRPPTSLLVSAAGHLSWSPSAMPKDKHMSKLSGLEAILGTYQNYRWRLFHGAD